MKRRDGILDEALLPWIIAQTKPEGGCFIWNGDISNGYGRTTFRGEQQRVHRVVWILSSGEEIPKGMWVLHRCDNSFCVRYEHLYIGNHKDNMRDMAVRDRAARAGVSNEIVIAMRKEYTGKWGDQKRLQEKYGLIQPTVSKILLRRSRRHV
jgi:hypothetical protein